MTAYAMINDNMKQDNLEGGASIVSSGVESQSDTCGTPEFVCSLVHIS